MILNLLLQDYVKYAIKIRLNVFSYPVVMLGHARSVLQILRTLNSLVLIAKKLYHQPTGYICSCLLNLYSVIIACFDHNYRNAVI